MLENDPVAAAAAAAVHAGVLEREQVLSWHEELGALAAAAFQVRVRVRVRARARARVG